MAPDPTLDNDIVALDASAVANRSFRYYDAVTTAFVAVLICSQLIGPGKITHIGPVTFGAGVLFFPVSYVIGDILTEIYGFARARRAIWFGSVALLYVAIMSATIIAMPAAKGWQGQEALTASFGATPRIVLASLSAFWLGEIANAFVLARLKIITNGRHLWTRTIGSTIVAQACDTLIFYPIAFFDSWSDQQLLTVMATNFVFKVSWEVILTPVTYAIVIRLKRLERKDIYDHTTDFSPFKLRIGTKRLH
jgi:uncharacterized integral membrane protein (TIGR00697 family)